jgi:predicted AAA+ superfamily ATPase
MYSRSFWATRIRSAWQRRSVVWLKGVRRVGKTVLVRSLLDAEYFDCELPRVRREMEDSEAFLRALGGRTVVLDEVHRLAAPSELLKIAADHFPDTRVLATGSSSLSATAKFADTLTGRKEEVWLTPLLLRELETADTLTGRKEEVWLTPLLLRELETFERPDLDHRMLRGGLPPFLLAEELPERDFQEWMDAFWAKDVLELFRLRQRAPFLRFVELLLLHSGGMFEATRYARPCEVSRTTISNYLQILETTLVAHVVRPFSRRPRAEIVSAPKVYGFDTGFVCYYNGWTSLRPEDRGRLWEHIVLNELHAHLPPGAKLRYWRTRHGNEIDFVLLRRGADPIAIECKWSWDAFDARNLRVFRTHYPEGRNYLVAHDVDRPLEREISGVRLHIVSPADLVAGLHGD